LRIPYEPTGAIGRQYISLGPEIIAAILLTLQSGWAVAHIDASVAATGEVEITERLRDGMRDALNSRRLPWSKSFIVALGMESRSTSTTITPDGRTDIPIYVVEVFLRYGQHDPHAIIECKRLDGANAHLCREYVVEGVDRFRTGKYAENHAAGFMAGYLLRGDAAEAADGVNAYLSRVRRTEEQLAASNVIDDPSFWRSTHRRADPHPPIDVHHALLATA
jgi:hypothetical protein